MSEQQQLQCLLQIPLHPPLQELQATMLLDSMRRFAFNFLSIIESIRNIINASLSDLQQQVPLEKGVISQLYSWLHQ